MPLILWTATPEAQALLTEAAANPPETRCRRNDFGMDEIVYTGRIARDLRKLRNDALADALEAGDKSGSYTLFDANHALTVDAAIAEAIVGARLGVAA